MTPNSRFIFIAYLSLVTSLSLFSSRISASSGGSVWGADHFPEVELTDHTGKTVKFFSDMIEDKVVAINFMFTSCEDVCPLETARVKQVYEILKDRAGKDVFFYSITIDPEVDTVPVLAAYAKQFGAGDLPGWTFLTGDKEEIVLLRRKLGVYIEDLDRTNPNNHSLNLVVGNQSTGRWMKRTPFENPYILATQLGGELHNWKNPRVHKRDYANAPKLRQISKGETLFRTRCSACHTIGDGELASEHPLGPDLYDVTARRDRRWLKRWITEPDVMIKERDPIVVEMMAAYDNKPMPNLGLASHEVELLLAYIDKTSRQVSALAEASAHMEHVPAPKHDHSTHQHKHKHKH